MDEENFKWIISLIDKLKSEQQDFISKSLLQVTQDTIKEQNKRLNDSKGELDGRIWNSTKW